MEHFLTSSLVSWLLEYGSFALFILLMLGIFALPVPDETLMVFAGVLMAHGKLDIIPTIIAAFLGTCAGITISYLIGRTAGTFLIRKYGHWIRLTEAKMQRVHNWFEKVGRWALFIGYFIPGVRHLTGYAAGISVLEYRIFALFSYSGALIWCILFLSIGYFLGNKWIHIAELLEEQWTTIAFIVFGLILFVVLFWWRRKVAKRAKVKS